MTNDWSRRELVRAVPATGLIAILAGCATGPAGDAGRAPAAADELYRVDDEATILAAARAILGEDWVATFITVDAGGMPRARSVGVSDPDPDLTLWISTRRGSRKIDQVRHHPAATLHFAKDDLSGNFRAAYYASFMGEASVHIDDAEMAAHVPGASTLAEYWPDYPRDYAVIRFRPLWLEVYGHGIRGRPDTWQPQAVVLPA